MNLRQIFCRHDMKRISYIFLRKTRERSGSEVYGLPVYCTYDHFIENFACNKCSKKTSKKTKYMATIHNSSVLR